MKISEYLRQAAREESDAFWRSRAVKHWQKIKDYLEDHKDDEDYGLTRHPRYKGFVITPKEIPGRQDVGVVLVPGKSLKPGVGGGIGKVKGGWAILIPVLRGPFDTTYLDTRWSGAKKVFIHEFIHYLDETRRKGRGKSDSAQRYEEQGEKAYYNTPSEFNAYYQEGAQSAVSGLKTVVEKMEPLKPGITDEFIGSFKAFMSKTVPMYWDKDFVAALNPKYKRKFQKRLANLYKWLRETYRRS